MSAPAGLRGAIGRILKGREPRFLLVGAWNTLFGLGLFTLLWHLTRPWDVHYALVYAVSTAIAITNAFACYRVFVFQTRGPLLPEYARFCASYAVVIAVQFGGMALLVSGLGMKPTWAQVVVMAVSVCVSWIAHSRFTFRGARQKE